MKIVDAQVHIWSKTVVPTSGLHRKVAAFTADELLHEMDEAGVDAALIHPPVSWDPDSNALAVDAAMNHPDRFAVMGQFPLDVPEKSYTLTCGPPPGPAPTTSWFEKVTESGGAVSRVTRWIFVPSAAIAGASRMNGP